jgi:hypothetical protein
MEQVLERFMSPGPHVFDVSQLPEALINEEPGHRIDTVVSVSCDEPASYPNLPRYWKAWQARERKFRLVCIVHNAERLGLIAEMFEPWVEVGAIEFVGLSPHVTGAINALPLLRGRTAATFVPIFDPRSLSTLDDSPRPVSRAVLQGNIQAFRRNYNRLLFELRGRIRRSYRPWSLVRG